MPLQVCANSLDYFEPRISQLFSVFSFSDMAVFKKLKKSKDKAAPLPEPEPVKSLDCRVGMDNYR